MNVECIIVVLFLLLSHRLLCFTTALPLCVTSRSLTHQREASSTGCTAVGQLLPVISSGGSSAVCMDDPTAFEPLGSSGEALS